MSEFILKTISDEIILRGSNGEVKNSSKLTKDRGSNGKDEDYTASPDGIYSAGIFGHYHRCICKKQKKPGYCPRCKVLVLDPKKDQNLYGHYNLFTSVIYEVTYDNFLEKLKNRLVHLYYVLNTKLSNRYLRLWNTKIFPVKLEDGELQDSFYDYVKDEEGIIYKLELKEFDPSDSPDSYGYYGANGLTNLFNNFKSTDDKDFNELKEFIHGLVIISPIYMRRATTFEGELQIPELSQNYSLMIEYDQLCRRFLETTESLADMLTCSYVENDVVNKLLQQYSVIKSSKESLVRYITSVRLPKSGRSVIVGRSELDMNTIYVPEAMAYEAIKSDIIAKIDKLEEERANKVPGYLPRDSHALYLKPDREVMEIFRAIIEGDEKYDETGSVAIINRAPTLHKLSMMAFNIKLWKESAIGMSSLIVEPFNADFDGDTMSIFFVTKDPTKTTVFNKMAPQNNWMYDKNHKPIFVPKNSMILGLYYASKLTPKGDNATYKEYQSYEDIKYDYEIKLIEFDTPILFDHRLTTYGRERISEIIEADLTSVLAEVDKKTDKLDQAPITANNIGKIIAMIGYKENRAEIVKNLLDLAKEAVTVNGSSIITLGDLYKIDPKYPEIKEVLESKMTQAEKYRVLDKMIPELVGKTIKGLNSTTFNEALDAGSKVKKQSLIEVFGPQVKIEKGEVTVFDESIMTGLSEEALINHAAINREILEQKAVMVPTSGYFTRQFVDMLQDLIYDPDILSSDTVGILVPKWIAEGRTDLNGNLIEKNKSNELIRIKSSVGSGSQKICKDEINYLFYKTEKFGNIGINLATSMSENITQSALGLKHGGKVWSPSENKLIAREDYTVELIDNGKIKLRNSNGNISIYPLSNKSIITKSTETGFIKKGEVIYYSDYIDYVDHRLAELKSYLGLSASDLKTKSVELGASYALTDGKLHYDFDKNLVVIGNKRYPISSNAVYYYSEGDMIKFGDRISSDTLNLHYLLKNESDLGKAFYIFMKELLRILYGENFIEKQSLNISLESIELLFKELSAAKKPTVNSANINNPRLLSRQTYGYNKQAVIDNVNKPIQDSVLLRLILGDTDYSNYQ
jgi:hypothetical protein